MCKILVTGASGNLGSAVLRALVKKVPVCELAGLVRDVSKASGMTELGIEIRTADYSDYDTLLEAFKGIEKIYLVSAEAFTERAALHRNVIEAAVQAGVRHVIYTGIQRVHDDVLPIEWVTESDIATEQMLKNSGLVYTIVAHPLYAEALPKFIGGNAPDQGFKVPGGSGRMPYASVSELAEAASVVLTEPGHEFCSYVLNSGQAWSFEDIADELTHLTGNPVIYEPVPVESYISARVEDGWPPEIAKFISDWLVAIQNGSFEQSSRTLEKLLGRKPLNLEAILRKQFVL